MADYDDHDTALEDQETDKAALQKVYERAMKRFDACACPTMQLRKESLMARRFITIPGAQWEGEWGEQFENSIRVEVDKVGRGLRKIETDYRENRIVPDFRPDGDKATEDTADMLDGLYRADAYRYKSQQALDNAAFEAFAGGFGAWRLTNEWEDESDKDNDYQRINPAMLIVDADQSVFFDLNARQYDKSDARYAFIRTALTREAFEATYGDTRATSFPEGTFWKMQDWFQPDICAVAEYYEKEDVSEALWVMTYVLSGEQKRIWASEFQPGAREQMITDGWQAKRQNRKRCRVHKYVLSGAEVLQDLGHIAGECIPIVPVYGRRYFVENMERWQGYVQDKMDRQRLYNSMVSKLAELNSLSPREIPIFAPEQMTPAISNQWAEMNIKRHPYALAEPIRNDDGTIAHMGAIGYVKPPDLPQVTAAILQIANNDLLEDSEDGADTVKANTSAEAMDIAAARVDAKSGIYLDNFRQSVERGAEVYLSMAKEVYSDAGRVVDTMTEDGNDGQAVLKQPVTSDTGKHYIANDLQNARYKVVASVTEATATRRDKTVRSSLNLADIATQAGDTELAQVALLTAVMSQDGEGMGDMQDYARKRLVAMGVVPPNDEEKQAMEAAAQNQQPDPLAEVAAAEAERLRTQAAKNVAEIDETEANTGLKHAQRIETLVKAGAERLNTLYPQPQGVN